jgi:Mce-associated membrane protein
VLSAPLRSVGVVELRDDRASVLVFVDQQILRDGTGHISGASQLLITAVRSDGSWKVEDITVL